MKLSPAAWAVAVALGLSHCQCDSTVKSDAGPVDAGLSDAGTVLDGGWCYIGGQYVSAGTQTGPCSFCDPAMNPRASTNSPIDNTCPITPNETGSCEIVGGSEVCTCSLPGSRCGANFPQRPGQACCGNGTCRDSGTCCANAVGPPPTTNCTQDTDCCNGRCCLDAGVAIGPVGWCCGE